MDFIVQILRDLIVLPVFTEFYSTPLHCAWKTLIRVKIRWQNENKILDLWVENSAYFLDLLKDSNHKSKSFGKKSVSNCIIYESKIIVFESWRIRALSIPDRE